MKILNLPYEIIIKLAQKVAKDFGMRSLNERHLTKMLQVDPPMPTIIRDERTTLWVDRYYIAYSLESEKYIHYVYIAPKHTKEEICDLPKRIKECRNDYEADMLIDILLQLNNAIKDHEKEFYIRTDYRDWVESMSPIEI